MVIELVDNTNLVKCPRCNGSVKVYHSADHEGFFAYDPTTKKWSIEDDQIVSDNSLEIRCVSCDINFDVEQAQEKGQLVISGE